MVRTIEKLFNTISIAAGIVGGFLCKFLGGFDMLLKAIVILVVLDYVTGLLKALHFKELSSEISFKGLIKKSIIFIVIATALVIQDVMGGVIPLREITIVFFVANEALSLLENAAELIPVPEQLKNVLLQLRDKNNKDESEE